MSPIATLVVLGLAAALWFGVLRPRLRGTSSRGEPGDGAGAGMTDGRRDHDHGADGDGDGGGGDGGGD
jgi:hypothetical protein